MCQKAAESACRNLWPCSETETPALALLSQEHCHTKMKVLVKTVLQWEFQALVWLSWSTPTPTSPGQHLVGHTGSLTPEGQGVVATEPPELPNASILVLMLKFQLNFQNLICSLPLPSALNNISCLRVDRWLLAHCGP